MVPACPTPTPSGHEIHAGRCIRGSSPANWRKGSPPIADNSRQTDRKPRLKEWSDQLEPLCTTNPSAEYALVAPATAAHEKSPTDSRAFQHVNLKSGRGYFAAAALFT